MSKFKVGDEVVEEVHNYGNTQFGKPTTVTEITAKQVKTADGGRYTITGRKWGHGPGSWSSIPPSLELLLDNTLERYEAWRERTLAKRTLAAIDEALKPLTASQLKQVKAFIAEIARGEVTV